MTTEQILQLLVGLILSGLLGIIWWDVRKGSTVGEKRLKEALYKKDGTTVFKTRTGCAEAQENIFKKIEEIKQVVKEADIKREHAREEDAEKWKEMYHFMGRIEERLSMLPKN